MKDKMRQYSNEQTSLIALRLLIHFSRHREKRSLDGVEHKFFKEYFRRKGRYDEYMNARRPNFVGRMMIRNWRRLGAQDYHDAIKKSTDFYSEKAREGENQLI